MSNAFMHAAPALFLSLGAIGVAAATPAIERYDARIDRLPAPDTQPEMVAEGFASSPGEMTLYVTDVDPDNTLLAFVDLGVPTLNRAWGEDGSVLRITVDQAVWWLPTRTRSAALRPRVSE